MSNQGTKKTGNISESYGKDSSDFSGPAAKERINDGIGGSVTNLSHTLTGAEATQRMGGKGK